MRTARSRDRYRSPLKNSMLALFAAGCATLAVTSCSGASDDPKASPTPSAAQPTKSADPTETAKKDAVTTYQAYWKEVEKLYADRSGKSAKLKQYAASAALKNAEQDAKHAHSRGLLLTGHVTVQDPTVTKVVTHGKLDYAVISSCLDISKWKTVKADTKNPVTLPSNRLTKYVIQSTVERWPEGWRVTRDEPQDRRC
ncbi:hypothetical protein Stsp01_64730 [Streptomyces sp. NBRC 13847]|uniref:hypothetical protein n=1 Tax=Streptomyces TaxID=1883 RepID=UPI0024A1F636|nr:hypothetical protein [Streptomyces sp. NBRC 13847]GLW19730.1 hypothetical protein Stsp01_64730 [Streptomyces sp. NBRC 13847]